MATVSRVINDSQFVSPELESRVREAIEALDCRRNALAGSLRHRRTRTLGLVIPGSYNPFFAEVGHGIEEICFSSGYNVILCSSENNEALEGQCVSTLIEKQVDRIVFVAAGESAAHVRDLLDLDISVVAVDREIEGVSADSVLTDNLQGGYLGTQHLLELGNEQIACISGPTAVLPSSDRVTG